MRNPASAVASRANPSRRGLRAGIGFILVALVGTALAWPAAALAVENLPPVAVDDPGTSGMPPDLFGGAFPIPEDWGQFVFTGSCSAIANDTDADGSIVAWQIVTPPGHGTLEYLPNFPSAFGYTPDPDFSTAAGDWVSDSFAYQAIDDDGAISNVATMRIWVAPINDPPTFLTIPVVTVDENSGPYDESWLPFVSAGPPNEADQTVQFVITQVESHGVVNLFSVPPTFTSDGRLTFTPGPDEHGFATVTVHLHDDGGLENYGINNLPHPPDDTSDSVTFTIEVAGGNRAPVAVDDAVTIAEDAGAVSVNVLANDSDPDGDAVTVTGTTDGAKGSVTITAAGTGVRYSPNPDANGSDQFTYTIADGNGGSSSATVHVTIVPVNDPPGAVDDGVPTPILIGRGAGAIPIAVLANDTSAPDGPEALGIVSVTQGSHGAVAIAAGGLTLTYDPAGNTTGGDAFTYTISDGHGGFDTATVDVLVAKDPTAPVVSDPVIAPDHPMEMGRVRLTVTWTAEDPESGVASSQLQIRRDGGEWSAVTLTDPTALAAAVLVAPNHKYQFRVRATNGAAPSSTSPFQLSSTVAV